MSMQNRNSKWGNRATDILLLVGFGYILTRACIEFYAIAWGSGAWLGEFSLKWGLGFIAFILFCIFSWGIAASVIGKRDTFGGWSNRIIAVRNKIGIARWLVVLVLLLFPVWFLQYTPWGVLFSGFFIRLSIWIYVAFGLAIVLQKGERLLGWREMLAALLLTTSVFSIAAALTYVIDYPFSLGWSEGNRLWDYSVLFGRNLYNYPADREIYSLTDVGRQLVGGLPFLFPNVSIYAERLWAGLTTVFPYILLGLAAFRSEFKDKKLWLSLGLVTFIFLKQGPIHPPLVFCALFVAIIWRKSLWVAIPAIFVTGYLAEASRYTWLFAPAIWIVMLEFSGALLENGRVQKSTWWRATLLGLSGALGGFFGDSIVNWIGTFFSPGDTAALTGEGAVSIASVSTALGKHPLLWYRLFPNATSGIGILATLVIAVTPMLVLLIYLYVTRRWKLSLLQNLGLVLPLLVFLAVGLVVSTKAGGGGDLHNLDMFLIGVLFTAVIAWEDGGRQWLSQIETSPDWIKGVLILLLVIPGIQPLTALRSFQFADDLPWLVTLTDVSDGKFLEMLPLQKDVDKTLQIIRQTVAEKESQGEVLFLDQRQLLTFGYVNNVPLVPEYEKKVLMNEAMADNADYFSQFYADLEAGRFSLIVSEPLRAPVKDSSYEFGEENNAWVKWVVEPVLCYYEEIETFRNPQIQLLVPRQGDLDCSSKLPKELAK